ncbi:MAG: aldo/keto reductase [Myxococcota bacterium]|nr:aldo/keto reductase [Myxococcota bacterium]
MKPDRPTLPTTTRRRFLELLGLLAIGGRTLLDSGDARAAALAVRDYASSDFAWPEMSYRTLGRTGFRASRLVFGCGAALSRRRRDELLESAFRAGINVFDVGFRGYYRDAEQNLAPFLKRHRDEVFLISKSMPYREAEPGDSLSPAQCKQAATTWLGQMDASLAELGVDRVDAYYLMASNNVDLIRSEEIQRAFESAKQAGKVGHLGLSTHQNAEKVLEAAAGTGAYSLAMIAITPAGWYDWADKGILDGTRTMVELAPVLENARAAGIGLVGMKAGRYLAGRRIFGRARPDAFDSHYDAEFLKSGLSAFQKSYAYVLAHGVDVVNADMQSLAHLQENAAAVAHSARHFA